MLPETRRKKKKKALGSLLFHAHHKEGGNQDRRIKKKPTFKRFMYAPIRWEKFGGEEGIPMGLLKHRNK